MTAAYFSDDLKRAAEMFGGRIEVICVGVKRGSAWKGVVVTPKPWAEAEDGLRYEYDRSFGAPDCHPVIAWTPTHVIFIHEFDGSTAVCAVPRNPQPVRPDWSGESIGDVEP